MLLSCGRHKAIYERIILSSFKHGSLINAESHLETGTVMIFGIGLSAMITSDKHGRELRMIWNLFVECSWWFLW